MSARLRLFFGVQRDFLRALFARLDPELCAFLPRSVALLIGVWLLLPFQTWDHEPGITPFRPFLHVLGLPATEPLIGGCFLLYGLIGYLSLSMGWRTVKRLSSAFGTFFWLWVCAALLIKNPAGILWIFVLPLALGALYSFIFGSEWRARP